MRKKTLVSVPPQPEVQEQPPPVLPEFLKVEEVMQILGVSRGEISNLMKNAGLPYSKIGKKQRNLRFDKAKFAIWCADQQVNP